MGADLPPPFSAKYAMDVLDSSSLEWAICMLGEHSNDPGTCLPGPRGQTTVSSSCLVRLRTSEFVTRSDQAMFRMRQRHHWSRPSLHFSIAFVMDQVSAPYRNTGIYQ